MRTKKATPFEVETVVLDSVPGFDSLFPLYEREYAYTSSCGNVPIWNKQMLQATNYIEFCDGYFQDLVRTRFIPKDLPPVLRDSVLQQNEQGQLLANIILDIYRLRYAGDLARRYIPDTRLEQYQRLFQAIRQQPGSPAFKEQIEALEKILHRFLADDPIIPAQ